MATHTRKPVKRREPILGPVDAPPPHSERMAWWNQPERMRRRRARRLALASRRRNRHR